jgi:hypothetical protein
LAVTTAQTIVGLLGVLAGFASVAAAIYLEQTAQARETLETNIPLISEDLAGFCEALFGDRLGHDPNKELRDAMVPLVVARGFSGLASSQEEEAKAHALAELSNLPSPSRKLHAMYIALIASAFPSASPRNEFLAQSSGVALLRSSWFKDEIKADPDLFTAVFVARVESAVGGLRSRTEDAAAVAASAASRLQSLQSYWKVAALVAVVLTAFCIEIIGRSTPSIVPAATSSCLAAEPTTRAMEVVTLGLLIALAGLAATSLFRLSETFWRGRPEESLEDAVRRVLSPSRTSPKSILAGCFVAVASLVFLIYIEATNVFLHGLLRCF